MLVLIKYGINQEEIEYIGWRIDRKERAWVGKNEWKRGHG